MSSKKVMPMKNIETEIEKKMSEIDCSLGVNPYTRYLWHRELLL